MTLRRALDAAARGRFPAPDGTVAVVGPPDGPADAVVAFTAHSVVATSLAPDAVRKHLDTDDFGATLRAPFLTWLGQQLGSRPGSVDAVLVAFGQGGPSNLMETDGIQSQPRVVRATRYRTDVHVWTDRDRRGVLIIGRGLAGRLEASFEVEPAHRGSGLGRHLAAAALRIVPEGEPLYMQAAPGNAASVRAILPAGFRPIAAECLFLRDASR